jgi:Ca2+/Na+ antiporter
MKPAPRGARAAYRIIVGISILNLLFVVGTMLWFNPVPVFGVSLIYKITLVAVAAVAFVWFLNYWTLSGWRF